MISEEFIQTIVHIAHKTPDISIYLHKVEFGEKAVCLIYV